jgi:peptide/nickel transport system permease protein
MRTVSFFGYFLLGLAGILLISCVPTLYENGFHNYGETVTALVKKLTDPSQWVYTKLQGQTYELVDYLGPPLMYSMTILVCALVIGFGGGLVCALLSCLLSNKVVKPFRKIGYVAESIPDVIIAFGIQLFVVLVYKQFGFLLFPFASAGGDNIYVLPILVIAILPFFAFYRIVLALIEEEQQKDYVVLAKSKGMSNRYILFVHILPNILPVAFLHTKVITWATLSTLPAIEYVMNLYGAMDVLKKLIVFPDEIVIFFILTAFFIPFYILYGIADSVLKKKELAQERPVWKTAPLVGGLKRGDFQLAKKKDKRISLHKNRKFIIGFGLILLLFSTSCLYTFLADPVVDVTLYQRDEGGALTDKAPFGPAEAHWLGTDRLGRHLDDVLLAGAKYTIGFAFLLAGLRIGAGLLLAIPYVLLVPARARHFLDKLFDGLHYVPQVLLAYFLLMPIIGLESQLAVTSIIFWQIIILLLLVLPLTTILMGKEIDQALSHAYITSGVVLGGSKWHLIRNHVWPQIRMRCFIMFGQQILQILVLFIHLGVFSLYFGGTVEGGFGFSPSPALTEWSSQIPFLRYMLMSQQGYYSAVIILAFLLLIFCVHLAVEGLREVEQSRIGIATPQTKSALSETHRTQQAAAAGNALPDGGFHFHDKTIELK